MKPLPGRVIHGQIGKGASRPKGRVPRVKGASVAGFIRGVVWGAAVAAVGLGVVSQIAPPRQAVLAPGAEDAAAQGGATPPPVTTPAPVVTPEPAASAPSQTQAPAPDALLSAAPAPETAPPPGPSSAPSTPEAPQLSAPDAPLLAPVLAPAAPMASAIAVPPQPEGLPAVASVPAVPLAPQAGGGLPVVDLPPPPPLTPEEEALLRPPVASEATPALDPALPPESPRPPLEGLGQGGAGVTTDRLPRIGAAPDAEPAEPAAEAAAPPLAVEELPPFLRHARPFAGDPAKPLFALLVEDRGGDFDRAGLAAMDLPLTVVIDPLAEGAAEHAALWRAGGQEVVLSLASLPEGATPGDAEQILSVLAERLPETVAALDPRGRLMQDDRDLAAQVVAILAEQGRGLVSFDEGLNAADQVARREGLPSATIFRRFDTDNASAPAVKRYLDRAVFRAAQTGEVAVIGALTPDTVAGILEWSVEGRAAMVNLAPLTALFLR